MSAPHRPHPPWWLTAALGAGVIAICYGFARYAYGLFVPQFTDSFRLSPVGIGLLGGLSTAGYGIGLLGAPLAAARSARATTVAAGTLAAAGLYTISAAGEVVVFATGVFLAGTSAGLVSPGVAQLVSETVRGEHQVQAQTWANTGTSLGLAVAAFTPLMLLDWNVIWLAFAVIATTVTAHAWYFLPRRRPGTKVAAGPPEKIRLLHPGVTSLLANSVLLGLTSAPYWTFSQQRILESGLSVSTSTWCWFVIGAFGIIGGFAGRVTHRYGLRTANLATWALWAVGIAMLALPSPGTVTVLLSAAIFGATYMALSGLCILWASRFFRSLPSRGVTLSFLGLAVGQTAGSSIAGGIAERSGLAVVFGLAALLSLAAWYQVIGSLSPPLPAPSSRPHTSTVDSTP